MLEESGPEARLQHALETAYRYLGRRDRTTAEVQTHLEAKLVESETVEAALAELHEQGYVDDARYARRYVEDRRTLDGWGADRIERGLRAVGVPGELIVAALAGAEGEGHDELGAALAVLRRRFRVVPETDRDRDRALGFLVRKGYDLELAYDAIRAYGR